MARCERQNVVDRAVLAEKIASIRDAVGRIREMTPPLPRELHAGPDAAESRRAGWARIHEITTTRLDDLLDFCEAMARHA